MDMQRFAHASATSEGSFGARQMCIYYRTMNKISSDATSEGSWRPRRGRVKLSGQPVSTRGKPTLSASYADALVELSGKKAETVDKDTARRKLPPLQCSGTARLGAAKRPRGAWRRPSGRRMDVRRYWFDNYRACWLRSNDKYVIQRTHARTVPPLGRTLVAVPARVCCEAPASPAARAGVAHRHGWRGWLSGGANAVMATSACLHRGPGHFSRRDALARSSSRVQPSFSARPRHHGLSQRLGRARAGERGHRLFAHSLRELACTYTCTLYGGCPQSFPIRSILSPGQRATVRVHRRARAVRALQRGRCRQVAARACSAKFRHI